MSEHFVRVGQTKRCADFHIIAHDYKNLYTLCGRHAPLNLTSKEFNSGGICTYCMELYIEMVQEIRSYPMHKGAFKFHIQHPDHPAYGLCSADISVKIVELDLITGWEPKSECCSKCREFYSTRIPRSAWEAAKQRLSLTMSY